MPDLLVKLYALPPLAPALESAARSGIEVRQAQPSDKPTLCDWVARCFGPRWATECEIALANRPVTCFVVSESRPDPAPGRANPHRLPAEFLVGFACYDATRRGMFGPEGVLDAYRGRGLGRALLLSCLHAMARDGYGYAVVGGAGPVDFYARTVGATVIEGSEPGIYRGPLIGD